MKKNLDTTKPCYSKHILPVPWPFIISRFHCIGGAGEGNRGNMDLYGGSGVQHNSAIESISNKK